ncbi:hypothetical protein NQ317_007991 [Molorchus minor]|uniref:CRAL-TRIO domain-containing protein n=1 Tax=Molorchus minor TaxID=1323400 RepID=A0ABQ9JKP5_9CUCU|nr:hypothetical protein NQ317_007991 [Molorchus minor]
MKNLENIVEGPLQREFIHIMHSKMCRYVLWSLERLVTEDYVLVYLHGAATKLPSFSWLKRCYQMVGRKLRKNLSHLYLHMVGPGSSCMLSTMFLYLYCISGSLSNIDKSPWGGMKPIGKTFCVATNCMPLRRPNDTTQTITETKGHFPTRERREISVFPLTINVDFSI